MIKSLTIKNLYGKDYDINFNEDLTIFYGKNGSGKTTILSIIYMILEGEIKKVCGYSFDSLNLILNYRNKESKLEIFKTGEGYTILFDKYNLQIVEMDGNYNAIYSYKNLEDSFDESSSILPYRNYIENKMENMKILSTNKNDEIGIENINRLFIKEIDLIYIPLNRKVRTNKNKGIKRGGIISSKSNKRNIEDTLKIAESHLVTFRSYINRIENYLNEKIREDVFNHLSRPINQEDIGDVIDLLQLDFYSLKEKSNGKVDKKIKENIEELLALFEKTKDSYLIEEHSRETIKVQNMKEFITHTFAISQLKKLQNVIIATDIRFSHLNRLQSNFYEIIDKINTLFEETGKKIGFDNREGNLYFTNSSSSEKLDISLLSSGEKQVVIFFIFSLTKYNNKSNSILLIDEPELSLHIAWQSQLLPLIMNNNNKKQIILATHSPDIISEYVNKCVEIKGV